ncbi:MAG: RNA polymerase sigma factor [Bacteroidia bacterium]
MPLTAEIEAGNANKIVEIYKLYRNEFIHWVCRENACTEEEAKDAFQEAVIAYYNNLRQNKLNELRSSEKTYLFSIGRNKMLNILRKRKQLVTFDVVEGTNGMEHSENSIDNTHNDDHNRQLIREYLDKQCVDCQKVLKAFYFEGKDMKTIAEEMGYKNADVAKKKKYECFRKLAEMVKSSLKMLVL